MIENNVPPSLGVVTRSFVRFRSNWNEIIDGTSSSDFRVATGWPI